MKAFLICPVRGASAEELVKIQQYVSEQEQKGTSVYWPYRDTDQSDPHGSDIIYSNYVGMYESDEVHIWWNPDSKGSLFDLGMAYAMTKPLKIVNPESVVGTPHKSFENILLWWQASIQ